MKDKDNNNDCLMDFVNVIALIIGLQNLDMNNKQILDLNEHLSKQDEILESQSKQYEEIIKLLKEGK